MFLKNYFTWIIHVEVLIHPFEIRFCILVGVLIIYLIHTIIFRPHVNRVPVLYDWLREIFMLS